MKKSTLFLILFFSLFKILAQENTLQMLDSLNQVRQEEYNKLADPQTGVIPFEELGKAREELLKGRATKQIKGAISPTLTWYERGPKDSGGNIRCIVQDPNDASGKKHWAGSLDGGLWYNNDITNANLNWNLISGGDNWASINISSIAFNPSNPQEMYVATGDYNLTESGVGSGIYKSTDGGVTFTRLSSTIPNSSIIGTPAYAFQYVVKIAINSLGHIFANTWNGLLKSTDGGNSWIFLLNGQTGCDLEIGNDNIIYAAFGYGYNTSRIYRSNDTNGTNWTDISPNTIGSRTELALANSSEQSSQVMYAYAIDGLIKWFYKSTNGGTSWTSLSIPPAPSGVSGDFASYTSGGLSMVVHPNNPNVVIAAGGYVTKSINGGNTWQTSNFAAGGANGMIIGNDGNTFKLCSRYGVNFSVDFGNQTTTLYNSTTRNNGFRLGSSYSVSMNNIVGDGTIIGGYKVNNNLYSIGTPTGNSLNSSTLSFIDQDNPNIVVGSGYLYNANLSYLATLSSSYSGATDYDSPNNIYYIHTNTTSSATFFDRISDVGSTNTKVTFSINQSFYPSFLRVGKSANTIFAGAGSGVIYKITNINSTPTAIRIDNGQLPNYNVNISAIDVGINDDEILVTFSNFGVSSVWYTNNGGITWINKDASGYGLPNIPVRHARFMPNTQKVALATELGVWTTNNINDSNPNWEPSNNGLPNVRCNWIYVRAADSVVAVATNGRGMFIAPLRGYPNANINNLFNKGALCKSGTTTVAFSLIGNFQNGTVFNVELSNSSGSFSSPTIIGSGTVSPINITIPSSLTSSNNYKIRISTTGMSPIISNESGNISVRSISENNLSISSINNINRSNNGYYYCDGATISLISNIYSIANTSNLSFIWSGPNGFNSTGQILTINNATATSAGVYTITCDVESCQTYTATTQLNLTNTPSIRAFSNSGTICPGASTTLNAYSDTFSALYPTFSWTGPNMFSSTSQFAAVNNAGVTASGVYTVTATFTGSCAGTTTATTNLNVTNTLPIGVNYSGTTCYGSNITLNSFINTSTSGLTVLYSWTGPNGFTSSLQNPIITNLGASNEGVYTVTVSYSGACSGSNTSTINISIPIISVNFNGTTQYCLGATTNLAATLSRSGLTTQYSWAGPNGFTSTGNVIAISNLTAANSGVYTVTATFSGTCNGTATNTTNITIVTAQAYSSIGNNYCIGTDATLSIGTSITPNAYLWTGPNGFTSSLSNPTITNIDASKAGTYIVSVTFAGCNSTVTATTAINLTNIIPQYDINQFRVGMPPITSKEYCYNTGVFYMKVQNNSLFPDANINTINWVGPNGFSNNNSTLLAMTTSDINNSGIYSVTLTFRGCSGTVTATTSVNISNEPKATAYLFSEGISNPINTNANVCKGNFIYLDAIGNNGSNTTSYSWIGPNGFSSNNSFAAFFPPQSANVAGVYTVTVNQTGACGGTASTTVQINFLNSSPPKLFFSPENYALGQIVTLSTDCPTSVKWTNNSMNNSINVSAIGGQAYAAQCITAGCVTAYSPTILFNNCMSTTQLTNNFTDFISKFESSDIITATNKVIPISNIIYDAQKSIILNPGFEVQSGSIFKAQIDGCGNN